MKSEARMKKRAARKAAIVAGEQKKRGPKNPKFTLDRIDIYGYDKEDKLVDKFEVLPHRAGDNSSHTPRQAKRSLLAKGAVTFLRKNILTRIEA